MDNAENGVIVRNLSTNTAVISPTAPQIHPQQPIPPPQSALPSYAGALSTAQPPVVYGSHQNTGPLPNVDMKSLIKINEKSLVEAYLLAISPFGLLGAHHFYLQRYGWGVLYFFTLGLCGIGYLIDWFRVPCLVKEANEKKRNPGKVQKTISDAYTLWFPLGLLGAHHYYLGNYTWGVLYTFTLGIFGIGWIVDVFRIPHLVRSANERMYNTAVEVKSSCLAVSLAVSPFGVLGAHHYYLNRPVWGVLYTFTGGLIGIGWIADWFRMHVLIKRANSVILGNYYKRTKTVDDAYILWFPFGLLGFHHFYLERPLWGLLYFFTLGIAGFGWLVDMCRIPSLVKAANLKIAAEQERNSLVSNTARQVDQSSLVSISVSGPPFVQGYPSHSLAYPVAFLPTNPTYPSQTFGYNHPQHPVMPTSAYNPTVYNWNTAEHQFPPSFAPPPYQAIQADHSAEELPRKQ